jgi:hypothetical protein
MNQVPDPVAIQARLAELLEQARRDERVVGEIARARREFFGADEPTYARDDDEREAAAVRFAEWFMLERTSDVLGEVPFEALTRRSEARAEDEALEQSRAGLFLTEISGANPQVRDLEGGERFSLVDLPLELHAGDLLVGRLFPMADGSCVPSAVLTILSGAAQLAVAFQKDIRRLGLDRRLTQIELEELVFRSQAAAGTRPATDDVPLERLEAELQSILDAHAKGAGDRASRISEALREADGPGGVLGPLMDEMAFDTDADLDALRRLGLQIWNAQHVAPRESEPPTEQPPTEQPPTEQPPARDAFRPRPAESLGQMLARRIEEGLSEHEDVEAMFADVERLLGESIDDPDDEDEAIVDPEVGDLAPLFREFVWEREVPDDEAAILDRFVEQQRAAPVPRLSVEYVEPDDYLRFLLRAWLDAPPTRRLEILRETFATLEGFLDWLADTQSIDLRQRLETSREAMMAHGSRLQSASLALSTSHRPGEDRPDAFTLMRVTGTGKDWVDLVTGDGNRGLRVPITDELESVIVEGDLLFGAVLQDSPGDRYRLAGMVVVVPGDVEHLLG